MKTKILGLLLAVLPMSVLSADVIPQQARQYFPIIRSEVASILPTFEYPAYIAGLIEHESCISLTHSKCWNSASELKSSREQGVGLGQVTRTFNPDGSIRFDVLTDMKKQNPDSLRDLSWANVKQRPDLQIRTIVLMLRNNYRALYTVQNNYERLAMSDAAYNGGLGGVAKERRACGLRSNCDPQKWFDNIENVCLKSKKALYGKRSACDINRHHVVDVLTVRMIKYKPYV